MQTRIDIVRADGDTPGQLATRSDGHAENPLAITVLNGTARNFAAHDSDGAFSLKWIPRGAACYRVAAFIIIFPVNLYCFCKPGSPNVTVPATFHPQGCIYFRCADIALTVAELESRGITITITITITHRPHRIAKMEDHDLWMVFFNDPDGHTLAVMQEAPKGYAPGS